jgi:hypothetical protein
MSADPFREHPPLFAVVFVVGWLVVSAILAYMSGWAGLAERFLATEPATGERFSFVSGSMGAGFFRVSYGNCLFVAVGATGLHLSILFLFRLCSPPLFIPWSAVASVEEKRFLLFRSVVVHVRDHWGTITLRGPVGEAIRHARPSAPPSSASA